MAFFLTCGTHQFSSLLQGYEDVTARCANCGNFSAHVYKRWHWFTLCFVPIIPFSLKPYHDVGCPICNFYQDVNTRPDVLEMMNAKDQHQIPMQPGQQQQPYYGGPTQNIPQGKPPPQYV